MEPEWMSFQKMDSEKAEDHPVLPVHTGIVMQDLDSEDDTLEETEEPVLKRRQTRALRTHGLFFGEETQTRDFSSALREVQAFLSKEYSSLVTAEGSEEVKSQIRRFAKKYIQDQRIAVEGMTEEELLDGIYSEMAEFGFLTRYIYGEGIEEIDINAWDDVEVQFAGGLTKKLDEHFDSPEHAINVVRRMLHVSGVVLDDASPTVLGHLSKNIRIAVLKTPIVDEDVGVAASIRIVNPQSMKKEDFIGGGTATGQMLDFLAECIRYGISVCVAGATSSGKTTLLGWLLTTIPDNKRIYSIENGSRELALVRRDNGRVVNSVIHTLTRDSENERQRVDQIALLDMALRFNPDIIVVGEMRGPEANAAQEAARTGVAVVTTIHSMSCDATYRRMVSLCKRAVDMSDETLMGFVTEAYPIVAFCKQLENRERRLMEIMECEIQPDGSRHFRPLFQYQIRENRVEGGKFVIEGEHRQVNAISESLARRFMENGMPQEMLRELQKIDKGEEKPI
ncbi:MAG: CpaF/VirB11 family protein [Lachnospiraceae bacterium]|nr:CpaF/VirB11 family protein [Lachnospiraceae bacterium]